MAGPLSVIGKHPFLKLLHPLSVKMGENTQVGTLPLSNVSLRFSDNKMKVVVIIVDNIIIFLGSKSIQYVAASLEVATQ